MPTLSAWSEARVAAAMRAWRRGCGPFLPWFRATPFASALHYRDRALAMDRPAAAPAAVGALVASLSRPDPATLWIFDLPGALGLWLAYAIRRRWRMTSALCWNAWYDPRGILDGRREIPLLLGLGRRLARAPAGGGVCLVFDADRQRAPASPTPAAYLDNRYRLGEDDEPALEDIRAAGWRRARVHTWGEPAADLLPYLAFLERGLRVTVLRWSGNADG